MPIDFFVFGNHETIHFFRWIVESHPSGPEKLIADAFKRAENLDPDDTELEIDTSHTVRDRLAEKLDEILWDWAQDYDPAKGAPQIGQMSSNPVDSLLMPILGLGLGKIDCRAVATALLIRARK
jgi:hypothetical protein